MRSLKIYTAIDGISTRVTIRKVPKKRKFIIMWSHAGKDNESAIVMRDDTDEYEYYEGTELEPEMFKYITDILKQYFPGVKAIKSIEEDYYEDYDDD